MNTYDALLNQQTPPSPLQLLYYAMSTHASCWRPVELGDDDDLAKYTGLDRDEVTEELLTIWLPIFKFKSSLVLVLEAMRTSHPNEIESDFCSFYLEVLSGIHK
jgi:hypothetical protein